MAFEGAADSSRTGSPDSRRTYWALSNFYFWYFALLGGLAPYWTVYLDDSGFSHVQIGQLMAILMVTKVLAPNLWSWLGDRSGHRLRLIRWGAFLALVAFSLFFLPPHFFWYALSMFLFSFFWNAVLPQFEVITLHNLGEDKHKYSLVRVWGSIGFVVAVFLLGGLFEFLSVAYLPWCLFIILFMIWLSALFRFSQPGQTGRSGLEGLVDVLSRRDVLVFLAVSLCLQMSHGAYYTFFSLYLQELGYSKFLTGILWAEGVLAEIVLFLFMHHLIRRYTIRMLMLFALAVTVIRWLLTGWLADSPIWLVVVQLGHAASFGIMHATAIQFIHDEFRGQHEGQGQALYSAAGFGAGGALGALMCGILTQWLPLGALFFVSALIALIALILVVTLFRGAKMQQD